MNTNVTYRQAKTTAASVGLRISMITTTLSKGKTMVIYEATPPNCSTAYVFNTEDEVIAFVTGYTLILNCNLTQYHKAL